jgi:hypothetical protein
MDSSAKTLEQQPPKISDSMAPMASHWGMVSMKTRPARAMARLKTGRLSSMPYISAFSSEGAALMTRGDGAGMAYALSPRSLVLGGVCWCLCSAGRRRAVMAGGVLRRGGLSSLRAHKNWSGGLGCYRQSEGTVARIRGNVRDGTKQAPVGSKRRWCSKQTARWIRCQVCPAGQTEICPRCYLFSEFRTVRESENDCKLMLRRWLGSPS